MWTVVTPLPSLRPEAQGLPELEARARGPSTRLLHGSLEGALGPSTPARGAVRVWAKSRGTGLRLTLALADDLQEHACCLQSWPLRGRPDSRPSGGADKPGGEGLRHLAPRSSPPAAPPVPEAAGRELGSWAVASCGP